MKKPLAIVGVVGVAILGGLLVTNNDAGSTIAPESAYIKDVPADSQTVLIPDDAISIKVSLSREAWPVMKDAVKVTSDYFDGKQWHKNDDAFGFTTDGGIVVEKGQTDTETFNESPLSPGIGRQIILHVVAHEDLNSSLIVTFTKESIASQIISSIAIAKAYAAIAHIQSLAAGVACGGATTCPAAFGSNVTAGSFIIATCGMGAFTPSVTDTRSNTYALDKTGTDPADGNAIVTIFSAQNANAGADTVSCAATGSGTIRVNISEYSGVATSAAADQSNNGSGNATAATAGSITPTQANELVYSDLRNSSNTTCTAGTSFTLRGVTLASPNSRQCTEEDIQTSATAIACNMTQSSAVSYAMACVSYKPAGGAAAATPPRYIFGGNGMGTVTLTGGRFIFQ